jgi:HPt (histidine-containing phosphotransfer) domain-containing protein
MKQAGFDDVLGKPFRLEDLILILSSSPAAKSACESPAMPSVLPGATFAALVTRVGGDEKLLKRMIQTFLRDTPKRVAGIAAIRRKNPEAFGSLAHALKGSVSIFGAEVARKQSQELQDLGRSSELSKASEALALLKEEIAKLQVNLRGYANQTPARPGSHHARRQRPPRNRGKRRR